MIKHCTQCSKQYTTKDSRQKTCSWKCALKMKSSTDTAYKQPKVSLDLPDPETLPAAYVKIVHDLWERLTTDSSSQKRIA